MDGNVCCGFGVAGGDVRGLWNECIRGMDRFEVCWEFDDEWNFG
jgi:hypothetical protein